MDKILSRLTEILPFSSGICTDSRKLSPGNIFFALTGDNFDGNNFARQALEEGAVCAVVDSSSEFGRKVADALADPEYGDVQDRERLKQYILTDNVLAVLQSLARWHREQFDIPVIALTGTNGKTTTKELVSAVLSRKFRVSATVGNLNNNIGVPLTLFGISSKTEIAVVEMGASHPGDIKELVDIVLPDYGLITNVGKAHLLGFGSFEGVKRTKGEMYAFLAANGGVVFYNKDNEHLCGMISSYKGVKSVPYGLSLSKGEVMPVTVEEPFLRILFENETVLKTHLVGSYNADNVITALAVGAYFGVPFEDACAAVSEYVPTNNRSELRKTDKNLLVIDAYNANPTSMKASLENFQNTEFPNKVLILGDMRELGEDSGKEHHAIYDMVCGMSVEKVFFVGSEFMELKSLVSGSPSSGTMFFLNVDMLREYLKDNPLSDCTILVKGSNGIKLQSIVGEL